MIRTDRGTGVLERLGPRLDELHAATGAPVTARRPWLRTWIECHPTFEPLSLSLTGADGGLEAVALLATRKRRLHTEFVALGAGLSDQVRMPARSREAAARLAAGVVEALLSGGRPWSLILRHLPPHDPVATDLAAALPCAELTRGDASPTLRFGAERRLRAYVSKNHHQQVRRMLNRMRTEGLEPVLEHQRARPAIERLLPEVESVCLERDLELRGMSLLERQAAHAFFGKVILEHATRGEVQLTTLRLSGQLAAYVVCFLDRGAYRMWNCRLAPAWGRYGAGRVANNAALEHALLDPTANEFDWMRGEEPYKLSMTNHVEYALDLRAWSAPSVRVVFDSSRRLKRLVKDVVAENEWLRPAFDASRRLKSAGRRGKRALVKTLRGS